MSAHHETGEPGVRTALSWRRTGFGLVGVCLVGLRVAYLEESPLTVGVVVLGLIAALAVIGFAERGVAALAIGGNRPVFALIAGAAVVSSCLALAGVVLSATA